MASDPGGADPSSATSGPPSPCRGRLPPLPAAVRGLGAENIYSFDESRHLGKICSGHDARHPTEKPDLHARD